MVSAGVVTSRADEVRTKERTSKRAPRGTESGLEFGVALVVGGGDDFHAVLVSPLVVVAVAEPDEHVIFIPGVLVSVVDADLVRCGDVLAPAGFVLAVLEDEVEARAFVGVWLVLDTVLVARVDVTVRRSVFSKVASLFSGKDVLADAVPVFTKVRHCDVPPWVGASLRILCDAGVAFRYSTRISRCAQRETFASAGRRERLSRVVVSSLTPTQIRPTSVSSPAASTSLSTKGFKMIRKKIVIVVMIFVMTLVGLVVGCWLLG